MAPVHAGMAMSLDGFVADRNGNTHACPTLPPSAAVST